MAAATWTSWNGGIGRSVKAVAASGTADAPTLATQGMSLDNVSGLNLTAEADFAQTLSGAGSILLYTIDPKMRGQASITIATAVATNSATINGVAFAGIANGGTPTGDQWAVGAGGSADADSATALAAAINAASARCLVTATAAAAVVTLTSTLPGDDPRSNVTIAKSGNPITVSAAILPSPWALLDLSFTVSASGVRRQSFPGIAIGAPCGRLAAIPTGVTVSGGGVTLYTSAVDKNGRAV